MKILIIGSGGREHAIAWKVSKSPLVDKIYCAPGNGGTSGIATNVEINVMDFIRLSEFAIASQIDLTIVGPDDPLVEGIVDVFEEKGLKIFGPRKNAAIIEGSKSFSKDLMKKYDIPTASYEVFHHIEEALSYVSSATYPLVVKADGLALGKGVLICNSKEEGVRAITSIMGTKDFGNAGNTIVIEEFMEGREVSVLCFCDGKTILPMASAQDHKRAKDNDEGLNTGGMGAFSPSPFYIKEIEEFCYKNIYQKTLDAMKNEGRAFVGILFVGLMLTKEGPKVLEYNARFGDPETQVLLPRMEDDIIPILFHCINGTLDEVLLHFKKEACVTVVLASDGYPLSYEKGYKIVIDEEKVEHNNGLIFHGGTKMTQDGIITNGGRVIAVSGIGNSLTNARNHAYEGCKHISFKNKYMRSDIGNSIL